MYFVLFTTKVLRNFTSAEFIHLNVIYIKYNIIAKLNIMTGIN